MADLSQRAKKFQEFLEKFKEGGEYQKGQPISDSDKKYLTSLLREYMSVFKAQEMTESQLKSTISLQKMNRQFLESQKDNFAHEFHYSQVANSTLEQQKRVLINQLNLQRESGHLTKDQIKKIREQILLITKTQKELKKESLSDRKGAVVAERLLGSTIGLSRTYNGPGGKKVMGALKGFRKGLKESVTVTNLLTTVLAGAVEFFFKADKAQEEMFKRSTIQNGAQLIVDGQRELLNVGIVDPIGKLAKTNMMLKDHIKTFDGLAGSAGYGVFSARVTEIAQTGADVQDLANISSTLVGVFHHNNEDLVDSMAT